MKNSKMKELLVLLLCAAMAASLAACGRKAGGEDTGKDAPQGGSGGSGNVSITDAGELVDRLAKLMDGKTGDMSVDNLSLWSAAIFSNWFGGMEYTEGTKVAVHSPIASSIAHLVLLIEPAEGKDAEQYAKELKQSANPRWQTCVEADTVKYAVKDGIILFIMTDSQIVDADAIIADFNA